MAAAKSRRSKGLVQHAILATTLMCGTVHAAVAISSSQTANITCASGVCNATAADAVLNVNDLTAMLASGDVTVVPGARAQDIEVAKSFSWVSPNRLNLDAYRSLTIDKNVTVAGPGALWIEFNDGGHGGYLSFTHSGRVEFWDLTSNLTIQGNSYVLVRNLKALAKAIKNTPSSYFALAKGFDAGKDGTYTAPALNHFDRKVFEGLGNSIANFKAVFNSICKCKFLGVIGQIKPGSTVRDLRLVNFDVENPYGYGGDTGALVARNSGTIEDVYTSGTMSVNEPLYTGGLAGENTGTILRSASDVYIFVLGSLTGALVGNNAGTIQQSYATGQMISTIGSLGGLVGVNSKGSISQSYADVSISTESMMGGLVAWNEAGVIQDSFATSDLEGREYSAGGLVGTNDSLIVRSYASGTVEQKNYDLVFPMTGGLVGWNRYGEIDDSFATGHVISMIAGGVVGLNGGWLLTNQTGKIHRTFSTGRIEGNSGTAQVGGVVGQNGGGTITDSYSTGTLSVPSGAAQVGGVVGLNQSTQNSVSFITNCYGAGQIIQASGAYIGGVIGYEYSPGTTQDCYWDLQTTGVSNPAKGAGNEVNEGGLTGLSTEQFQSGLPPGFDPKIWTESPGINNGYPYLVSVPPPGEAAKVPSTAAPFSRSYRASEAVHRKFLEVVAQARKLRR